MMTIQEATYFILNKLRPVYPEGEASQITDWVMEHLTGSKKAERMIYKNSQITKKEETQLSEYADRLIKQEPVQYVLNEAWFCGMKFYVDKRVLIPRPETEELVEWVVAEASTAQDAISILDVGTGSGCIPLSLKRKLKNAEIWGCDISAKALEVSKRNSTSLALDATFLQLDFLNEEDRSRLPSFDIIVSNPPYVPEKDKLQMHPNVLNHEPHQALFVPDNNVLIFYRAIAEFAANHLHKNGVIYLELHEDLAGAASNLFKEYGYQTAIKKDMQGKERMLKAST